MQRPFLALVVIFLCSIVAACGLDAVKVSTESAEHAVASNQPLTNKSWPTTSPPAALPASAMTPATQPTTEEPVTGQVSPSTTDVERAQGETNPDNGTSGTSGTTTEPLPATTTTVEAVTTSAPPSATTTTLAAGPPLPLRTPVRRCTPAVAAADVRRWAEYTVEWTDGYVESASGWIGPGAGHYAIRSPRGWDNWFWLSPMSSYSTELQCT